jgi:hypothetical protein
MTGEGWFSAALERPGDYDEEWFWRHVETALHGVAKADTVNVGVVMPSGNASVPAVFELWFKERVWSQIGVLDGSLLDGPPASVGRLVIPLLVKRGDGVRIRVDCKTTPPRPWQLFVGFRWA